MESNLRKTGIDVLGEIPWGTHFCQFYETQEDLLEVLVPYFKAGLENNEFCLWVTYDPISVDKAFDALRQTVLGFDQYLEKQSIEIRSDLDWKADKFDTKTITNGLKEKLHNVLEKGFEGMRVNGNETWLKHKDWEDFMNLEREINNSLRNQPIIILCTYPLANSTAGAFLDVAHVHECVITRRKGKWEILEAPEIKKSKAQLKRRSDELEQRVAERTSELAKVIEELKEEIEERKKAEEKLIKEKELSKEIIESFPGVFKIVDKNYKILAWNHMYEVVTGYTAQEIPHLHVLNDMHDASDRKRIVKLMQRAYTTGICKAEVNMRTKDGSKVHFYYIARPINYNGKPCLITSGIDITELKKAERELSLAYKRLTYHVENSPLAVIECDRNMTIKRWSKRSEEIFGWKEAEVLGKNMFDLKIIYEKDKSTIEQLIGELLNGTGDRNQSLNRNYTKDGNVVYCEWYNSALRNQQGNIVTILSLVHDVTKRVEAEETMHQSYQQIRSLTEHLQNIREEERTSIAREIHDELGQQLTVLKMDVAWLSKKINDKNDAVKEKLMDLMSLLDNTVQSVRRISSELRPGILDDLGLAAAIEWHLNEFEKRSGIKTHFIYPEEERQLPGPIKTNLYRILQESLTNVARHAQAKEVKVNLVQQYRQITLNIKDDGVGFDQEQVSKKRTLGILGMKERAAMMGGRYEIQSKPGKGTTISVVIPLPHPN